MQIRNHVCQNFNKKPRFVLEKLCIINHKRKILNEKFDMLFR